MHPPTASALRSLFRAARSLPSPVRAKLVANVRDVAELGLGTKPTDAAALARLVHWVEGLPKVRGREKKEGGRKSPSAHASLSHAVHAQGLTLAMGRPGRASRAAAREREREREKEGRHARRRGVVRLLLLPLPPCRRPARPRPARPCRLGGACGCSPSPGRAQARKSAQGWARPRFVLLALAVLSIGARGGASLTSPPPAWGAFPPLPRTHSRSSFPSFHTHTYSTPGPPSSKTLSEN